MNALEARLAHAFANSSLAVPPALSWDANNFLVSPWLICALAYQRTLQVVTREKARRFNLAAAQAYNN